MSITFPKVYLTFAAIYKLGSPPPEKPVPIFNDLDVEIHSQSGPFEINITLMTDMSGQGIAGGMPENFILPFLPGAYLITIQKIEVGSPNENHALARIKNAEIASICDLQIPGWIVEKMYEGAINIGNSCSFYPEKTKSFRSWIPKSNDEIHQLFCSGYSSIQNLSPDKRERYQLMSRWYRKAAETENPIDQFLFLYTALEVYPAQGTPDVPRSIQNELHATAFPEIDTGKIKELLKLSRLVQRRCNIIHDGKSFITQKEFFNFNEELRILEAVTHECLNLLAERPYTGQLDKWVRPSKIYASS